MANCRCNPCHCHASNPLPSCCPFRPPSCARHHRANAPACCCYLSAERARDARLVSQCERLCHLLTQRPRSGYHKSPEERCTRHLTRRQLERAIDDAVLPYMHTAEAVYETAKTAARLAERATESAADWRRRATQIATHEKPCIVSNNTPPSPMTTTVTNFNCQAANGKAHRHVKEVVERRHRDGCHERTVPCPPFSPSCVWRQVGALQSLTSVIDDGNQRVLEQRRRRRHHHCSRRNALRCGGAHH